MSVFAYGTLMFPEVVEAVLGHRLEAIPAVLWGFSRFVVAGRSYPGVVPDPAGEIRGQLLMDVDADSLKRLDRFEGEWYERLATSVRTERGRVCAFVYVVPATRAWVLSRERWNEADFRLRHLQDFLNDLGG